MNKQMKRKIKFTGSEENFVNLLEKHFLENDYLTKREVNIGNGVADLVLAKVNDLNIKKRINHKQITPLLSEYYFQVLKVIPDVEYKKTPVSVDDIVAQTNLSKSFLRYKLIRNLEALGYIKNMGNQKYLKINGWLPIANEVVAIEAKLKNWKAGFIQANRYKVCADKVYLALPINVSHLPDKTLFKKFGIGLISFDTDLSKVKILIKPKKNRVNKYNNKRNFVSEFFLNQSYI